jgi:tRNA(fMet)-specific endonuclease VapC
LKGLSHILDTDICIYLIKKKPQQVIKKISGFYPGNIGISSITLAELQYGVSNSQHQERNLLALQNFLLPLEILPFDDRAAIIYGDIRTFLEKKGTPIGSLDLMIAAHTKSLGLTLVTNNTKEFSRIPTLAIENWVKV